MRPTSLVLLIIVATHAEIPSMYGNNEMHQYRKAKPAPLNDDVPYLMCPVCEKMAAEALKQVTKLVAAEKPDRPKKRRFETSSRLGGLEEATEDILSEMCDPDNDGHKEYGKEAKSGAGAWIARYDVAKSDRALVLERQPPGHCRRECWTISKACDAVLEKLTEDEDADVAAYLVNAAKEKTSAGIVAQRLCTKMSGVCKKKKVPLWPEGKPRMNEQFKPKTEEDFKLERNVANTPGENGNGITIMKPGDYDFGDGKQANVDEIDVLKEEL